MDRQKYMDLREVQTLRTVAQAEAILDLRAGRVRGPLVWMLVDLALESGLRVSEIVALTVGDFDPKRCCLRVHRHKRRTPVTETLAISPELAKHLTEFVAWKGTIGQATGKKAPLFVGKRGGWSVQGAQLCWRRIVATAGLPRYPIHAARHTCATHLLKRTGNLRLTQARLGHVSPVTTANMYGHVTFEDSQAAVTGLYEPVSA
jgi:integrase/recombinase XerD